MPGALHHLCQRMQNAKGMRQRDKGLRNARSIAQHTEMHLSRKASVEAHQIVAHFFKELVSHGFKRVFRPFLEPVVHARYSKQL
eukprot:scaffold177918_cov21-Tisochrysis_lutea.AAC.1